MNKSMALGAGFGAVAATTAVALAGFTYIDKEPDFAEVMDVKPVKESYTTPREECYNKQVTKVRPVQDQHQVAGTVVGALVGGLIGNQFGGGSGKKIATVAGAAAGGYAGNQVQEGMQQRDTYTTTQRVCKTVQDKHEKIVGYDVQYKLGDNLSMVRMDYKPGPIIPVKNGKLVLQQPVQAQTVVQ